MPMTQKEAAKILRKNAPPGEFPAFINPQEAAWLKGMGGSGEKTKSGLRSYFLGKVTSALGLGGGGPAGPQTSRTELDPEVKAMRKKTFDAATAAAAKPHEKFTGDRFAAAGADTLAAQQQIRGMQGQGQDAFKEAGAVGKDVSGYSPDQVKAQSFLGGQGVDQYMSPHTANVIQGMQDNAMRTMQKQRGALQAQHQMAGAGMGSRGALEHAAMMGEVQRNLGQQVSGALEGAYGQAAQMKQQDMQRQMQADQYNQAAGLQAQDVKLRGAQQQMAGAQAGRQAGVQDAQLLSQVGADIEGRQQNQMDFDYGQWKEGRDWDKNNAMFLSNITSGAPSGQMVTQSAPQSRNKLGSALGAGLGAFASTGNPWLGLAAGGASLLG